MVEVIVGQNIKSTGSIIRINNTTQYAVGDVINGSNLTTPIQFTVATAPGRSGWIIGGQAFTDKSGTTLPDIDMYLFRSTFTIPADNANVAFSTAQMKDYIGKVKFETWNSTGSHAQSDAEIINPIKFASEIGSKFIYGIPVAQNTYTPASAEELHFALDVEQY